ncbi:hypothetical protein HID58_084552 [Brassica napus]|uniref:Replication factor A C-terminal domain-containing protein n=1 Tax=Brassica napus TaxID=3708 RepID=A0ABQ7XK45_BRANA|nr:hypothetical protein HID58_084552 [Brassica napus]
MAMKRNGKAPVSSDSDEKVVFFNDVSLGPHESQLRFRLIHFWEARNPVKKTVIGLEMLLIDEQGTVVQGFIPPGRIKKFLPDMKRGSVYKLINFYGSKKSRCFIHMKISKQIVISEVTSMVSSLILQVISLLNCFMFRCGGPVMKLYLWDQAATEFCQKFKTFENTPTVILVTTVNPKRLGGTLALSSMSSTRVFMDNDVQPTIEYSTWLGCNPDTANQVIAEVVTKRETLSIADIFSYIKQDSAKDAFFECTATIDDVVHGSAWYYIACSGCHSKATKGPTSMVCTNTKCEKVNTTGVAEYRAKISVYDNSEQAVFVLLGDAGRSLTGKHASELLSSYFEANGDKGAEDEVPVPEALISIIGQTHRFCVKVTDHNFSGNTRAITVTKVLSQDIPPHTEESVGNNNAAASKVTMLTRDEVSESSKSRGDCANEESKRGYDTADPEKAKRPRCEN